MQCMTETQAFWALWPVIKCRNNIIRLLKTCKIHRYSLQEFNFIHKDQSLLLYCTQQRVKTLIHDNFDRSDNQPTCYFVVINVKCSLFSVEIIAYILVNFRKLLKENDAWCIACELVLNLILSLDKCYLTEIINCLERILPWQTKHAFS